MENWIAILLPNFLRRVHTLKWKGIYRSDAYILLLTPATGHMRQSSWEPTNCPWTLTRTTGDRLVGITCYLLIA